MKRKVFYTLYTKDGYPRAVEKQGWEIKVGDVKVHVYENYKIYVIDPATGMMLLCIEPNSIKKCLTDVEIRDLVMAESNKISNMLSTVMVSEKYRDFVKMYNYLSRGQKMYEKVRGSFSVEGTVQD